jgi:hypothetical protein
LGDRFFEVDKNSAIALQVASITESDRFDKIAEIILAQTN